MKDIVNISVITVCRNAVLTIDRTIQSVLNQQYDRLEYIIIDGNSEDGTQDAIRKYLTDERIRFLSEPDRGIYDAMNKGIKLATGEYLEFLNAGDTLINNQVLKSVADKISRTEADIVYGDILYEHPDGTVQKRVYGQFCSSLFYYLLGDCINHQAIFARKECFTESFDLTYEICADREWMIRQKKQGKNFKTMGIIICKYSLDENSTSIKYKQQYYDEADRCVREHLRIGYPLFWGLNKIRNGKLSARILHGLYQFVFIRKSEN